MVEVVPPYIFAVTKMAEFLNAIKKASVPSKFTADYLGTSLGFKSSSDRAFIPLLKRLGFINQNNEPTDVYKKFRDEKYSKIVMAEAIREAFPEIFTSNEYAYQMSKSDFTSLVKRITGFADDDRRVSAIVSTFFSLKEFADFEIPKGIPGSAKLLEDKPPSFEQQKPNEQQKPVNTVGLGISYTINLNLPATTNIEVFNAIFKSLKENILSKD